MCRGYGGEWQLAVCERSRAKNYTARGERENGPGGGQELGGAKKSPVVTQEEPGPKI